MPGKHNGYDKIFVLWDGEFLMKIRRRNESGKRHGFSLLELLAVVTILGIIAVVVLPRISVSSTLAKQKADAQNKAAIELAVERWFFENGTWPADDLSDIGADKVYFPSGLPTNPTNGASYSLNSTTHRVK